MAHAAAPCSEHDLCRPSRSAHRHAQPLTGHSLCLSNHSRMWSAWPPWRHDWHQTIQWPKAELDARHTPPAVRAAAACPSAGSGQPMCCRQTAQRGSAFLHFGFGHTVALGVGRRNVDSAARPGGGGPGPAFMRGAPLPVTSEELQ